MVHGLPGEYAGEHYEVEIAIITTHPDPAKSGMRAQALVEEAIYTDDAMRAEVEDETRDAVLNAFTQEKEEYPDLRLRSITMTWTYLNGTVRQRLNTQRYDAETGEATVRLL